MSESQLAAGQRWRHKRRGTLYTVMGFATMQSAAEPSDNQILVIYRDDHGAIWARVDSEFLDGRFTLEKS